MAINFNFNAYSERLDSILDFTELSLKVVVWRVWWNLGLGFYQWTRELSIQSQTHELLSGFFSRVFLFHLIFNNILFAWFLLVFYLFVWIFLIMPPKIRKYDSGHEKRMKKKRAEALVESQRRSLNKLKLLKSYLRSTMLQDRLNGLALIAIENDILETVEYEDLIDDFASKSVRRMTLFK
ncbi:hypothetical protein DCAR_0311121 [Daucus carota subsp. sativus]|uniref:Uncharacterized protein n=1 Tax=Daucus carota subsp. sativus TaxID=79200 RepID=A0AAF0WM52_DAUCS|nr:PREDICTED: uncharacterized protein LOC108211773 [Daucus carota subsp. sativus]WOG91866.1 hypothetical protein DCAR_0311121 [Daucus carota subsp. sativus]